MPRAINPEPAVEAGRQAIEDPIQAGVELPLGVETLADNESSIDVDLPVEAESHANVEALVVTDAAVDVVPEVVPKAAHEVAAEPAPELAAESAPATPEPLPDLAGLANSVGLSETATSGGTESGTTVETPGVSRGDASAEKAAPELSASGPLPIRSPPHFADSGSLAGRVCAAVCGNFASAIDRCEAAGAVDRIKTGARHLWRRPIAPFLRSRPEPDAKMPFR